MRATRRRVPVLAGGAAWLVALCSCGLFGPEWVTDPNQGRVAVVLTNTSDDLTHVLLSAVNPAGKTQQWLVPVGPHGWESLVLDCAMQQIIPLGTLVTTAAEPNGVSVPFDGQAVTLGNDYRCGSVIAVQTTPSLVATAKRPVQTTMRVARRMIDTTAPGVDGDGFVIIDVRGLPGVPAAINLAWEDPNFHVYESTVTLTGNESGLGFLERCPMLRFAAGHMSDPHAPLATVAGRDIVGTMAPLESITCGSIVTVALQHSPAAPTGYELRVSADSTSASALTHLFADAQAVLQGAAVAIQPTNALQLYPAPPPGVPVATP